MEAAQNLPRTVKNVLRLTRALPGGALTILPGKLRQIFFSALGTQVHPLHPWLRLCLGDHTEHHHGYIVSKMPLEYLAVVEYALACRAYPELY